MHTSTIITEQAKVSVCIGHYRQTSMKLPYANIDHYYRTSYTAESPCRRKPNEYQTTLYQPRGQFHKHIKELILQQHNS
jgi:hypothetical protein